YVADAVGQEPVECVEIHVSLERVLERGLERLGNRQVDRLGSRELDVCPRRVEVGVVRDDLARPTENLEEDLLCGPALVGRDDVAEGKELLDRLEERVP